MNNIPGIQKDTGADTLAIISAAGGFNEWMYDEIKKNLKGAILEIGSGIGNISSFVLKHNAGVTLSDYNSTYITGLKEKFAGSMGLNDVLIIDLESSFFEQTYSSLYQQFDSIFLLNVIEHIKDDVQAVSNCYYMLKPGGRLTLLAPAFNFLYCNLDKNLGHYRRYTRHTLSALLAKNKMMIADKKYFNLAGIMGWLLWGKLLRKPQLGEGNMRVFNKLVPLFRLIDLLTFRRIGLSAIVAGEKI